MTQSNMTLNTKVYAANGSSNGTSFWVNRDDGIAAGFSSVEQTVKEPSTGTQVKIDHKLTVPILASADTTCGCAGSLLRTSTVMISVWVNKDSTTAERTDVYLRLKDLVADPQFIAAVENYSRAI